MIAWYLRVIRNYVTFRGRAGRSEYWWFALANFLILFVLYIPVALAAAASQSGALAGLLLLPFSLYTLFIFLPSLAVSVRRLHDTGRSGWWYLLVFIPGIGGIVLLILSLLESEPGTNQYGPHPSQAEAYAPA